MLKAKMRDALCVYLSAMGSPANLYAVDIMKTMCNRDLDKVACDFVKNVSGNYKNEYWAWSLVHAMLMNGEL